MVMSQEFANVLQILNLFKSYLPAPGTPELRAWVCNEDMYFAFHGKARMASINFQEHSYVQFDLFPDSMVVEPVCERSIELQYAPTDEELMAYMHQVLTYLRGE